MKNNQNLSKAVISGFFVLVFFFFGFLFIHATGLTGDLNSDSKVDIFDYNILVGDFGKTGTNLKSDLDSNNKVDIFDYNLLIADFGKTSG